MYLNNTHTHSLYPGCFRGLSVWPWSAHFAGSRTSADTLGHRNASSLLSTSQTLSGYPAPYSSHSAPPGGHREIFSGEVHIKLHIPNSTHLRTQSTVTHMSRPCSTSHGTSWHMSRCRNPESCCRAAGSHLSYRAGCSGYSWHTSNPAAW